jgi:hypothetical protein
MGRVAYPSTSNDAKWRCARPASRDSDVVVVGIFLVCYNVTRVWSARPLNDDKTSDETRQSFLPSSFAAATSA